MASWWLFLVVNAFVCSALSGLALGSPSSDVAVQQEHLRKWKATARPDVPFLPNKVSSRFISNELKFLSHRALLQVAPVVTPVAPPVPTPPVTPPVTPVTTPVTTPAIPPPAPAPVRVPAPPTPVRTYLMWAGIGAFGLVLTAVAVCFLCRKFGQRKMLEAKRLPPLPRYK